MGLVACPPAPARAQAASAGGDRSAPAPSSATEDQAVYLGSALLVSWIIITILWSQLKSVGTDRKYADRRRAYWQELAHIDADMRRNALDEIQQQHDPTGWNDIPADGERNTKQQAWRLRKGRARNQATSQTPHHTTPDHTTRPSQFLQMRTWTRR